MVGRCDLQNGGEETAFLPPPMEEYQELEASLASLGKLHKNRRSPPLSTRSSVSTHFQSSPGSAPRSPPFQAKKKIDIPQEVWLAAEKHRKSNFFAAAVLPSGNSPGLSLFPMLSCVEVTEVINLAMTSFGFASALLGRGCEEKLWQCLGDRAGGAAKSMPFAGDPVFRMATWTRRQRFVQLLRRGATQVAVVVPPVTELGGPKTTLGPFLPSSSSESGRLVVCDHQTCHILDVERLQREQVEIDRYGSKRLLLSSLKVHPTEVTTSWPLDEVPHCCAAGGMVAAKPLKGPPSQCGTVLQWLELPHFGGAHAEAPVSARTSLRQEQLAFGEASSLSVESTWPLPENQVLLLVRSLPASPTGTKSPLMNASPSPKAMDARGAMLTERPEACGRWSLQVWCLDHDHKELRPHARVKEVESKVRCINAAHVGGMNLLLCGAEHHAELLDMETLHSTARWEVGHGPVKEVLICQDDVDKVCGILAQENAVLLATGDSVSKVLPHEAFGEVGVVSLRAVGAHGFAVCSRHHVYAFEVSRSHAELKAVVELPGTKVEHFFASPYEFFVVLGRENRHKPRSICCLWPAAEDKAQSGVYAVNLRAWTSAPTTTASSFVSTGACHTWNFTATAVDLKVLTHGAAIDTMTFNSIPLGRLGQDLLAVAAVGAGVMVFRWGMEVNPILESLRELREAHLAQQEEQHQREILRRQLQRLQQRLQETEKLEDKIAQKGREALTAEELAKVARRPQVEADVERLLHELGLDQHSEEGSEVDPEEEREAELAEKRRAKERVQRRHHAEKRAMQQERQKNRDRKFS